MKDVIEHLVEDLDWRLTPAGKLYKPDEKELISWGVERNGCWPTVLIWFAMMISYIGLVVSLAGISEDFFIPVGSIMGLVLSFVFGKLAGNINRGWQKRRDKRAYRKLLRSNERFMLVEYSKYLSRKIHQAQHDPTLGGAAEVSRLRELQGKINEMLRRGGSGKPGRQSRLEEEATIAESILEAYGDEDYDPLKQLDARLPEEVRKRLGEEEARLLAQAPQQTAGVSTTAASAQPQRPGPGVAAQPAKAAPLAASGAPTGKPGPAQPVRAPQPVSKQESELPRWARELGQIIESLDLDDLLQDERSSSRSKRKEQQ